MAEDPFPRERVAATLRRMPAYLRLAWRLARDPLLSRARRAAVIAAAGYLASPIDLVPGVIPVIGQLDDIAVALAALKFALAGLDPERRREHLAVGGPRGRRSRRGPPDRRRSRARGWSVRAPGRPGRAARRAAGSRSAARRVQDHRADRRTSPGRAASKAAPAARSAAARRHRPPGPSRSGRAGRIREGGRVARGGGSLEGRGRDPRGHGAPAVDAAPGLGPAPAGAGAGRHTAARTGSTWSPTSSSSPHRPTSPGPTGRVR